MLQKIKRVDKPVSRDRLKMLKQVVLVAVMISAACFLAGCQVSSSTFTATPATTATIASSLPETLSSRMTYEIVNTYPHDPNAFTQGLIYLDGFLYESTGLYEQSSLRKVNLETGDVLRQVNLPREYFAEGLTEWDQTLIQLTWLEETGFVYDRKDFRLVGQFTYATPGWGITQDGNRLIMSDGTATLYFLDAETFQVVDRVVVTDGGEPIGNLNELEFIRGEVFANIWQTDEIIRINPGTGEVKGWIDLRGLLPEDRRTPETDVLNGIAYDPGEDRLFVTGKRWPDLFEIRLVPLMGE